MNGLASMVSGFHLNRKVVPTSVVSISDQVPTLFLTLWVLFIWKRMHLPQNYVRNRTLNIFFSLKKKESIIGSAFKPHLCGLTLLILLIDTFFVAKLSNIPNWHFFFGLVNRLISNLLTWSSTKAQHLNLNIVNMIQFIFSK